jgi:DNA primase catalytic core
VAGRINEQDIAAVRERAKIDEIVGSYVTLRNAGGGSMKGLCPFHEESTPSFNVTPSRGLWYCFGACGEGGDAIAFIQKVENLSFTEAVQKLADRVGIQLRVTDDGGPRMAPGLRVRLMDAHKVAAEFFAEQLSTPDALVARQFLAERGFDRAAAEEFGVGAAGSARKSWSPVACFDAAAGISSPVGCCGRSAMPASRWSASVPGGSSRTTGCRLSTSTLRKPRSTRSRRSCTASTWPGPRSAAAARR